jgi:hypothetical protein
MVTPESRDQSSNEPRPDGEWWLSHRPIELPENHPPVGWRAELSRGFAAVRMGVGLASTAIAFLRRAVAFYRRHGIIVERVLTDMPVTSGA